MNEFETLVGLVSQYSPSGQERGAVEWLVARMKSLHYNEAFIDEAGNAVGVMGSGPKQAILLGHIDTVPGEISVCIEEDALYGRGAVDAKGALACFADAVAHIGSIEEWQFIVIGAVEEEGDSNGARHIAAKYKPDYAVIGEPNRWDRVALGYKGSAWADITIKRAQAHTASGEQTACEAVVEAWLAIKSFADSFNVEKPRAFDKIIPTLRGMDSGQDGFEQWAQLNIGVRLPLDLSPTLWYEKLESMAGDAKVQRLGYAIPAWACDKNTPLVRAFLSGIRSQGGEPSFVYKTGTADLNVVAPVWKCPMLVYGPGDSKLDHTPDEHISLNEYETAIRVLGEALKRLVK
ncbi:MAG TPA: [LysW]-lysine hydrolase [Anaerolineales bacterium]|nr:[LysW]-lysine hydrolase [Anaerolineales bacterium]